MAWRWEDKDGLAQASYLHVFELNSKALPIQTYLNGTLSIYPYGMHGKERCAPSLYIKYQGGRAPRISPGGVRPFFLLSYESSQSLTVVLFSSHGI